MLLDDVRKVRRNHAHEVLLKLVVDIAARSPGHTSHPAPLRFERLGVVAPLVGGISGVVQDQAADADVV